MKKLLCSIAAIAGLTLNAQINYEASDFLANGDSMLYSSMTLGLIGFDFDTTGANISWDFSALEYEDQESQKYYDPNNSGYRTNWCSTNSYVFNCLSNFDALTNKAIQTFDETTLGALTLENGVTHAKLDGNLLTNVMLGRTAVIEGLPVKITTEFEKPDTVLQFPFTMGSMDSSFSRIVSDFSPAPIIQSENSKRVNEVEGYGNLKTPYGDFSDVLKMKTVITRNDTTFTNGTPVPIKLTEVEYSWWSKDYGLPVLKATGNQVGNYISITQVFYLDSSRCVTPNAFFTFAPISPILDPVNKTVEVQFVNRTDNADSLVWTFSDGSISNLENPTYTYDSVGTFTVNLMAYNTCDPANILADTVTLPVVVIDTTCIKPTALFTISPVSPILDPISRTAKAEFVNKSTYTDSLVWEFSDGSNTNTDTSYFTYNAEGSYPVKLMVYNTSCSSGLLADTTTLVVVVRDTSLTVSASAIDQMDFEVYPNPTNSVLRIDGLQNQTWEIFNMEGKLVSMGQESVFSIDQLNRGIYFLKVGQKSVKIVVQK